MVFDRDYLPVLYRVQSLAMNAQRLAEVPALKLFPSATVFIQTVVDKDQVSISPKWEFDKASRPAWVAQLLALDNGRESNLDYKGWIRPNMRRSVVVPADA